jgi:hypothetical protein
MEIESVSPKARLALARKPTDEARKLAVEAAARMKSLPRDDKNPLTGAAGAEDLVVWLAYKAAKALIGFDAAPPGKK